LKKRTYVLVASTLVLAIALVWMLGSAHASVPQVNVGKSLANLEAAYQGESNAHARYLAFAEKADEEGYGQVASLFRAAARAEQIHAANHAEVIKQLGGEAAAKIEAPDVKSTAENLQAAIKGESYERDTMYPEFIATARQERARDAIRSFNYAQTAEAEHAKLYQQALDNLEAMRGAGRDYYVCTVCGMTTTNLDFAKCASCFSPKEKYVAVR